MPQASVAVCAWLRAMFDGFALERIDVGEAELRVRHGGAGPPILLLHGHPRTQCDVASRRAGARRKVHRGLPRPTRLRRIVEARDDSRSLYGDPVAVWRGWAEDVRGLALDSGPRRYPKSWPPRSRRFCWLGGFRDCPAEAAIGPDRSRLLTPEGENERAVRRH